jgi:hypothetical protein
VPEKPTQLVQGDWRCGEKSRKAEWARQIAAVHRILEA